MSVKVIVLLGFVATVATMVSAGVIESGLKSSTEEAFANGMKKFGAVKVPTRKEVKPAKPEVEDKYKGVLPFSEYTAEQGVGVSGGKPLLNEQYINNKYTPLVPTKVVAEHKNAKDRHVPQRPYQYSKDIQQVSANVHF